MKKLFAILALIPSIAFSQDHKGNCSKVKSHFNLQLRSNTFSVAEIAETERYDVHFYFLDLEMTNTSTYLEGSSEMQAIANENLDSALIEFYPSFTISTITVDGNPVAYSRVNTAIKIPVNKLQGENFSIKVFYSGTPPTAATNPLGGGGMTNDDSPSWGNWVTWSLSEPFAAYEWFPCKQSLKDKIDSCAVWVTVPTACKAGSNGLLENITDFGNGTHRFEWKHRYKIDYYLISVAVAEYVEYNVIANPVNSGPVLIQNFIYNNPGTLPNFQADIDETADFIELYDVLYGPYPFANEKYGHCMAPIGGGMEHQTMTTQGFFNNTLTAHELAHQWFGNHVTCASWADIWVNEGFASYSEHLMLENLYPGQEDADMMDRHNDVKSSSGGSVWVLDSLNDASIFSGRLVYNKGASIIHTLRFLINDDDLFFDALHQYQSQYAFSTASGLDFIHVVENVTGMNFTNFMQEWYFGEGFPTYFVRWNLVGNDMHIQIQQNTSQSNVTPLFTNDLELRINRGTLPDTNIRFQINANLEQYIIPNAVDFVSVSAIDPDNWIINGNGSITQDASMFVSVDDVAAEERLKIFPNPTDGPLTVLMKEPGTYTLTILDVKGKLVYTGTFSNGVTMDLSAYAKGTYLFQFVGENGQIIRKLITRA
jgi:aminopeptidase N